jgi:hypothetical protein
LPFGVYGEFRLSTLQPQLATDALQLNGGFDLGLSAKVEEALGKGIELDVLIDVQLERPRALLWNETLREWTLRREIRYHALSGQYVVSAPEAPGAESFTALSDALRQLGAFDALTLKLDRPLAADTDYQVRVRARLDVEALPAPLRPVAYSTAGWRLNSGWSTWKVPR